MTQEEYEYISGLNRRDFDLDMQRRARHQCSVKHYQKAGETFVNNLDNLDNSVGSYWHIENGALVLDKIVADLEFK